MSKLHFATIVVTLLSILSLMTPELGIIAAVTIIWYTPRDSLLGSDAAPALPRLMALFNAGNPKGHRQYDKEFISLLLSLKVKPEELLPIFLKHKMGRSREAFDKLDVYSATHGRKCISRG